MTEPPGAKWFTSCGAILISGRARDVGDDQIEGAMRDKCGGVKPRRRLGGDARCNAVAPNVLGSDPRRDRVNIRC